MKIIRNKYLPAKGFVGINLFGVLFIRHGYEPTPRMLNHESIHSRQIWEMLGVFFYLWYGIEWLFRLIQYKNSHLAYRNISFEREAYENEKDFSFLESRKFWNFIKYIIWEQ